MVQINLPTAGRDLNPGLMENTFSLDFSLELCGRMPRLQQVFISPGPEGFQIAEIMDRFNQIGFTLAVISVNPVESGCEFGLKTGVIAKTG